MARTIGGFVGLLLDCAVMDLLVSSQSAVRLLGSFPTRRRQLVAKAGPSNSTLFFFFPKKTKTRFLYFAR